jgi:hypothetical protein
LLREKSGQKVFGGGSAFSGVPNNLSTRFGLLPNRSEQKVNVLQTPDI